MMGNVNPSHPGYFCEELTALRTAAVQTDCQWVKLLATDVTDPYSAALKNPKSTMSTPTRIDKLGRHTLFVGSQTGLRATQDLLNDDSDAEESDLAPERGRRPRCRPGRGDGAVRSRREAAAASDVCCSCPDVSCTRAGCQGRG